MKNHPHIFELYELFNCENHPFRKVHRMIDLFESIIKSHTAVIISDYFRHKKISNDIKGLLADGLRAPALGTWNFFSKQIIKEIKKEKRETFLPGFVEYFDQWNKKHVDKVISFRNIYAHGATPDNEDCEKDIREFTPILEEWLTIEWLNKTKVLKYEEKANVNSNHVYLIKGNGQKLDLFPILCFKRIEKKGEKKESLVFFNDLKWKRQVSFLDYSYSLHIRDKEIYEEFQQVIKTEQWKANSTDEFKERIEELTEMFKGRAKEKKLIKDWIEKHDKGYLFLFGKPGVGKSALVAQTLMELKKLKNIVLIECFIRRINDFRHPWNFLRYINERLEEKCKTGIDIGVTQVEMKEKLDKRLKEICKIKNRKKIVIFIDGLDEGNEDKILSYLISETYKNIIVIYSSRKTAEVDSFYNLLPAEYKWEKQIGELKGADIRAMLYDVTDKYSLTKDQVVSITQKSEGNPLYVKMLCLAIQEGEIRLEEGITLPKNIDDFYKLFLERYSRYSEDEDDILKSLYVFAAAKDYLTQKHLEIILGIGPAKSERIITVLEEVLNINSLAVEKEYQLFHESMREYLIKEKKNDIREAENHILNYCRNWKEYTDPQIQRYALTYYSDHLISLNQKTELYSLVLNREYQAEQIDVTEQFEAGFTLIENGLLTFEKESSEILEFGIEAARLQLIVANSLQRIKKWISRGGTENYDKAFKTILNFEESHRVILFFILLRNVIEKESREYTNVLIEKISNNLTRDPNILNLLDFLPPTYLFQICSKLSVDNLHFILSRIIVKSEDIDSLKEGDVINYNIEHLLFFIDRINFSNTKEKALLDLSIKLFKCDRVIDAIKLIVKVEKIDIKETILSYVEKIVINNYFTEALELVKDLQYHYVLPFLQSMSVELVKLKKNEEALSIVEHISDEYNKYRVIEVIAIELLKKNKINDAIKLREKIGYHFPGNRISEEIALKYIRQNKIIEALKVAENCNNKLGEAEILQAIILELVSQDQEGKAKEIVNLMKYEFGYKFEALISISSNLYIKGKIEESEDILNQTINATNLIKDYLYKSIVLRLISIELGNRDKFQEALKLTEKITDTSEKEDAIKSLSIQLAQKGQITKALKTAKSLTIENQKDKVLQVISFEYAKLNKLNKSIKLAKTIQDDTLKEKVLLSIARELSKQGKVIRATALVTKIGSISIEEDYELILSQIIDIDQIELARMTAEKLGNSFSINKSLSHLACKFAKKVDLEKAKKIIDVISDNFAKEEALSIFCISLANQYQIEKAKEIVESFTSEKLRKKTMRFIIDEFSKQNKVEDTEKLLINSIKGTDKIEIKNNMDSILESAAIELARLRKTEEANHLFKAIQEPYKKCMSLISIAEILSVDSEKKSSKNLIVQVKKLVDLVDNKILKDSVCTSLSILLSRQSKVEEALKIANKIEFDFYQHKALTSISLELVKSKKMKYATEIIKKYDNDKLKDEFLKSVALEFAKKENTIEALDWVDKINDDVKRFETLLLISTESFIHGNTDTQDKLIQKSINILNGNNNFSRDNMLSNIGVEFIKQDKILEGREYINKIKYDYYKYQSIKLIATEVSKKNNFYDTFQIIKEISKGTIELDVVKNIFYNIDYDQLRESEKYIKQYVQIIESQYEIYSIIAWRIIEKWNDDVLKLLPRYIFKAGNKIETIGTILLAIAVYQKFIKTNISERENNIVNKIIEIVNMSRINMDMVK